MRAKSLAQEQNALSPARARTGPLDPGTSALTVRSLSWYRTFALKRMPDARTSLIHGCFLLGLILCSEPYYNEAGYEKQRGTAEGHENSRLYNEMVLLKLVQSMEKLLKKPPTGLEKEILQHFAHHGSR